MVLLYAYRFFLAIRSEGKDLSQKKKKERGGRRLMDVVI